MTKKTVLEREQPVGKERESPVCKRQSMHKEVVGHTHNGILLSFEKEHIWVSSNKVDEPGAYYTEGHESETESQILYINAYIWSLERWHQWSYMQGSKGDTDVKNRLLDSVGEDKGGMFWENSIETCKLLYVKQMASASLIHEAGYPKLLPWDNLEGYGGEGGGSGFQDGGTHVHLWPIHVDVWQQPSQYYK